VVFIWFGALKFSSASPVGELVAKTVPFLPPQILVPALGAFEVLLGVGLLVGRQLEIVALLMVAHLTGTFMVLVTQPGIAFQHGNPFMLTMTGEFVVKNVVLITAGIMLATLRPAHDEPLPVSMPASMPVSRPMPVQPLPAVTTEVPAEAS
jgi:putative oxidoreductase